MRTTRHRVLGVLATIRVALWVACLLSMAAFSRGADQFDEGVNVTALYLAVAALTLTVGTIFLAVRPEPPASPAGRERDPARPPDRAGHPPEVPR